MKKIAMLSLFLVLVVMAQACAAPTAAPSPTAGPAAPAATKAPAPPAAQPTQTAVGPAPAASPAAAAKAEAQAKPVSKEPYKIGFATPLSGPMGGYGVEWRNAAVLEVERVNATGGIDGHQIEMIVEDDAQDPTKAATVLTKLIRQDNVLGLAGPYGATLEASARPVTEREQVPQVLMHPSNAEMRAKNFKWSFTAAASEIVQASGVIEALKEKGYKKVIVIAENSPLYLTTLDRLQATAPAEGIQVIVAPDNLSRTDVDSTPQATKIKDIAAREKPQAIVPLASGPASVTLMKSVRKLAIDLPAVGMASMASAAIFQMIGDEVEGMVIPGPKNLMPEQLPDSDLQKAVILDYNKRFVAKYGKPDSGMGAYAADAVNILLNGIKTGGPDRSKIRDAIEKTTKFAGLIGVYNYTPTDHEGLGKDSMAIYQIDAKNKKFGFIRTIK